ncbi:MAG: hypothetical protein K9W44_09110 [Candidatus Lokiarchaeota archaeon]|nr:hypothetical protein [Candidatus Harpocratesius repetitus]
MFNRSASTSKPKLIHRKNEAAPMFFFIDQIESPNFPFPILPMPVRIDRIISKLPTLFIFPHKKSIISFQNKNFSYDYTRLYSLLITNLLKYTEQKYRTLFFKQLSFDLIEIWWNESKNLVSRIHSYSEDLSFILDSYLNAYIRSLEGLDFKQALIGHIDEIIEYCNSKFSENKISIDYKKKKILKNLYKKKGDYIFPDIIQTDIFDLKRMKTFQKAFVPMLLYDDLLECYLYNKKLIDPDGFEQLEDAPNPDQSGKNKERKKRFLSNIFKKSANSLDSDNSPNEDEEISIREQKDSDSLNKSDVNIINFQKLIDLEIIKQISDIDDVEIKPEEIFKNINIDEIFEQII